MDLNQFGEELNKHLSKMKQLEVRLSVLQKNYDAVCKEKSVLEARLKDDRDASKLKEALGVLETRLDTAKGTIAKVKEMTSVPRNKAEKDLYLLTSQVLPGL